MIDVPDNTEPQPDKSVEQREDKPEVEKKPDGPTETAASIDEKILVVETRIDDNVSAITDTDARLAQVEEKLQIPPQATEPFSIAMSQEDIARLEAQKQALAQQKEGLEETPVEKKEEAPVTYLDLLKSGKLTKARELATELSLSDDEFTVATVGNAPVVDVLEMIEGLDEAQSTEVLALPEIQTEGRTVVLRELASGHVDGALQMIDALRLAVEVLMSEEMQKNAIAAAIEATKSGSHRLLQRVMTAFNLPKSFMASPEVIAAAQQGIQTLLSKKSRPRELATNFVAAFAAEGLGDVVKLEPEPKVEVPPASESTPTKE